MRRTSAGVKTTSARALASGSDATANATRLRRCIGQSIGTLARSVSPCSAARSSKPNSHRPGMWNSRPEATKRPSPARDTGPVVHAVPMLGHLRVDARRLRRVRAGARTDGDLECEEFAERDRRGTRAPREDVALAFAPRGIVSRQPRIAGERGRCEQEAGQRRPDAHRSAAPNNASPFFHAMRSATSAGRSASQARDQRACSTMKGQRAGVKVSVPYRWNSPSAA